MKTDVVYICDTHESVLVDKQAENATSATDTDISLESALRRNVATGATELDTSPVTVPVRNHQEIEEAHHPVS
jgi:hypothetical protein